MNTEKEMGSFNIVIEISDHLFTRGKLTLPIEEKITSTVRSLIDKPGIYKLEVILKVIE